MLIEAEPTDLLMVRYKFYFNQERPDPEDPWVLAYLDEHGLEPRRELEETHEGVPYKVWHFGQCYLGRHLEALGEMYRRGIEHTVLAQHLQTLLGESDDAEVRSAVTALDDADAHAMTAALAAQLHASARFEATEANDLRVILAPEAAVQAFRDWQQETSRGNAAP